MKLNGNRAALEAACREIEMVNDIKDWLKEPIPAREDETEETETKTPVLEVR